MHWIEVIVSTAFPSTPTMQQERSYSKPSWTVKLRSERREGLGVLNNGCQIARGRVSGQIGPSPNGVFQVGWFDDVSRNTYDLMT